MGNDTAEARMSKLARTLQQRFYRDVDHPYVVLERRIDAALQPVHAMLDAGCGRSVPLLRKYIGRVRRLIGVDVVDFTDVPPEIETYKADLARLPLKSGSVDLIVSRSVFEHLTDPSAVYAELARVLRPGGLIIFLTANMWDYGTLAARIIPNRFHASIVKRVEGRAEEDTFPTAYRTNTRRSIERHARAARLDLESFEYVTQYPNYLLFNGALFFVGMCYERIIARFRCLEALRGWVLVALRKPAMA